MKFKVGDSVRIESKREEWRGQVGVIVRQPTPIIDKTYLVRVVPAPRNAANIPWADETYWAEDRLTLVTGLDVMLDLLPEKV